MASHQATKAISLSALQRNNKMIYVSLLFILSFFLLLDYVQVCRLIRHGSLLL